jgi:hypothetical protein
LFGLGVDRSHGRRQSRFRFAQVECQRRVEAQRQSILAAIGGHRRLIRNVEHVAGKSRLVAEMHRHRHGLFLLLGLMRQTFEPLGFAGKPRQFLDDVLRQAGRRSGPGVRQQIDKEFVAGGDGIDRHFARQPDADGAAVGIAPRGADIFRRLRRQAVD